LQERCLCRLLVRSARGRLHVQRTRQPSSKGRGDRVGKRYELGSAEAVTAFGPGSFGAEFIGIGHC